MTQPFQVKGAKAEWEIIYDHISSLPVDAVVTYDTLSDLLDREFLVSRQPFNKANRMLLRTQARGLKNIKNKGYRVVTAAEHGSVARTHHRRSRRQMTTAVDWVDNTRIDELSAEQRRRHEQLTERLHRQEDFMRRLDKKVDANARRTATEIADTKEELADTKEKVKRLTEILARNGFVDPSDGDVGPTPSHG